MTRNHATLIHGLADAERVICLSGGIRELLESDDPGDNRQTVALDLYLAEGVLDLLPVAESAGVILTYTRGSTCSVFFEPRRLRQALFLLLEFALGSSRAGTAMNVQAAERDRDAILLLTISPGSSTSPGSSPPNSRPGEAAPEPEARPLVRRLGLAIARGIFEAAGGDVQVETGENCLWIEVRLPLSAAFPGHAYPSVRVR
jgi:hypothetical protein